MLMINQLYSIIQPSEVFLVKGCSQLMLNLIKVGLELQDRTFTACKRWVLESLEFSEADAASDILFALQCLLTTGPFDSIDQDLRKLLGENSVLLKHVLPQDGKWGEEQFLALTCLKAILINKEKSNIILSPELLMIIKATVLQTLSKLSYDKVDKLYFNKLMFTNITEFGTRMNENENEFGTWYIVLNKLNDLLLGTRVFLSRAEDVAQKSFVTFFSMHSYVIKEIYYTISLLLSSEKNINVLTQGLKCAAALAQGTPYSRLKPGLATKLIRNYPTVRVAALSVFNNLALTEPITPEILNILAKSSNTDSSLQLSDSGINTFSEMENEEIVFDDFDENLNENAYIQKDHVSALVEVCLRNISNEAANVAVGLHSLKLLATLAFNASDLIFSQIELIVGRLIDTIDEKESQVSYHACRVSEIITGRLVNLKSSLSIFN